MRAMILTMAGVVALVAGCAVPGVVNTAADPNGLEVVKAFEQYDCDRNGVLTFAEVKDARMISKTPAGDVLSDDRFYEAAYPAYDNDGDGGLSRDEYAKMWKAKGGQALFNRPGGACGK